jgi:acyl carrier protein
MVTDKLRNIILKELKLSSYDINEKSTAKNVPGWDSLKHMNIILAVETEYNIKFKGLEILRIKNVGDLQNLINSKI